MTRIMVALSLAMLAGTATAGRTVKLIENGIETRLADVTMPSGGAGTVIVEQGCDGCALLSLRASPETRYFVGDTALPHAEFLRAVARIEESAGGDTGVVVFYDRESGRVTRIKVSAS